MIQVFDFIEFKENFTTKSAVTIGNFDGCHLGHQYLSRCVVDYADRTKAIPLAVTFSPRPDAYFRQVKEEPLLFSDEQNARCLAELGIQAQILQPFDSTFSQVTHQQFFEVHLLTYLKTIALVVGDDFRFGNKRLGDLNYLKVRCQEAGVALTIGNPLKFSGSRISSSRIREIIQGQGDMDSAEAMLGRPYLMEGVITKGDQIGRQIGMPTANLGACKQLIPKHGVYLGFVWLEGNKSNEVAPPIRRQPNGAIPAVINIGVRPSLGLSHPEVRVEAHLLAGSFGPDALYGLRSGFYLRHRLRDERRFGDLTELKQQIVKDIDQAQAWLKP